LEIDDQNPDGIRSKTKANHRFDNGALRRDSFWLHELTKHVHRSAIFPSANLGELDSQEIS